MVWQTPSSSSQVHSKSNAPIPSTDKTVWIEVGEGLIGMSNTLLLNECYWSGAVARQRFGNLLRNLLRTRHSSRCLPPVPLTPPVGLRNAVIRPRRIPCTTSTSTSARGTNSLSHLPQQLAVPRIVGDHLQVLGGHPRRAPTCPDPMRIVWRACVCSVAI